MTDKIVIDRDVVEQAMEALFMYKPMVTGVTFQHGLDAMQALRAALEQPRVEQSSVVGVIGWKNHLPNSGTVVHWTALMPPLGTKLYTHPHPPRQPLTDDEINTIWRNSTHMTIVEVVRAIEAAHGIGGEAASKIVSAHNTSPPAQRKPLTDEQIHDCFQHRHRDKATERRMITRAIEFAHGITGDQE